MSLSMTSQSSFLYHTALPALKLSVAVCALAFTACSSATYVDEEAASSMPSADDSELVADCPSVCEETKDCPDADPTPAMEGCESYCADLVDYSALSNCSGEFDALLICHAKASDKCGGCNVEKGMWAQCITAGPDASDAAAGGAGANG